MELLLPRFKQRKAVSQPRKGEGKIVATHCPQEASEAEATDPEPEPCEEKGTNGCNQRDLDLVRDLHLEDASFSRFSSALSPFCHCLEKASFSRFLLTLTPYCYCG